MSWNQLLAIYAEAADERRRQQTEPPQACPHDGEPLRTGPDGTLHCTYDGYVWSGAGSG